MRERERVGSARAQGRAKGAARRASRTHQAGEGQLAQQQVCAFLEVSDLHQRARPWSVPPPLRRAATTSATATAPCPRRTASSETEAHRRLPLLPREPCCGTRVSTHQPRRALLLPHHRTLAVPRVVRPCRCSVERAVTLCAGHRVLTESTPRIAIYQRNTRSTYLTTNYWQPPVS